MKFNILTEDFSLMGVDVMDGAVKGTFVFMFSIFSFYIAYWWKHEKNVPVTEKILPNFSCAVQKKILYLVVYILIY